MADSKVHDLTANTTPATGDLLYLEDDPGGTPADNKMTLGTLKAALEDGGTLELSLTGMAGLLATAQTPAAHATSHKSGGSDAVKLDELAAPTDVTTLNASATAHGLLPKLSNVATEFLNGVGAFAVPAGAIGGSTGATDNAVLRADGAGGATVQNSLVAIQDTLNTVGAPAVASSTDLDTGVYWPSTNNVCLVSTGGERLKAAQFFTTFENVGFGSSIANGPGMQPGASTSTVPGVCPNFVNDANTGIGWAGADQLALIAGGVNGLMVEATKATFAGRILGKQGADVVAANDITLGNGNYFDITGATQINTIVATGWVAGSQVTLQFDSTPTVKHNTAGTGGVLLLSGAADFVASAGDTLSLVFDGTAWRETSRAVI